MMKFTAGDGIGRTRRELLRRNNNAIANSSESEPPGAAGAALAAAAATLMMLTKAPPAAALSSPPTGEGGGQGPEGGKKEEKNDDVSDAAEKKKKRKCCSRQPPRLSPSRSVGGNDDDDRAEPSPAADAPTTPTTGWTGTACIPPSPPPPPPPPSTVGSTEEVGESGASGAAVAAEATEAAPPPPRNVVSPEKQQLRRRVVPPATAAAGGRGKVPAETNAEDRHRQRLGQRQSPAVGAVASGSARTAGDDNRDETLVVVELFDERTGEFVGAAAAAEDGADFEPKIASAAAAATGCGRTKKVALSYLRQIRDLVGRNDSYRTLNPDTDIARLDELGDRLLQECRIDVSDSIDWFVSKFRLFQKQAMLLADGWCNLQPIVHRYSDSFRPEILRGAGEFLKQLAPERDGESKGQKAASAQGGEKKAANEGEDSEDGGDVVDGTNISARTRASMKSNSDSRGDVCAPTAEDGSPKSRKRKLRLRTPHNDDSGGSVTRNTRRRSSADSAAGDGIGELYNPTHLPGMSDAGKFPFQPHLYTSTQFCDSSKIGASTPWASIRILRDSHFGYPLADCRDYDGYLRRIVKASLDEVRDLPQFIGCAAWTSLRGGGGSGGSGGRGKKIWKSRWESKITSVTTEEELAELLRNMKSFIDREIFGRTFGGASLHVQNLSDASQLISAYYWHTDVFGGFVLFVQLVGISYTFVAVPGHTEECEFDKTDAADFVEYERWKGSLDAATLADVRKFERGFMAFAKDSKPKGENTRILVHKLVAGQRLSIAAGSYPHASIIPKQNPGEARSLLVCHDLEKYDDKRPSEMVAF